MKIRNDVQDCAFSAINVGKVKHLGLEPLCWGLNLLLPELSQTNSKQKQHISHQFTRARADQSRQISVQSHWPPTWWKHLKGWLESNWWVILNETNWWMTISMGQEQEDQHSHSCLSTKMKSWKSWRRATMLTQCTLISQRLLINVITEFCSTR